MSIAEVIREAKCILQISKIAKQLLEKRTKLAAALATIAAQTANDIFDNSSDRDYSNNSSGSTSSESTVFVDKKVPGPVNPSSKKTT